MEGYEMTTIIYPMPEWIEQCVKSYSSEYEKKLKKITGDSVFHVKADPEAGIEKDLYISFKLDFGKLISLSYYSEEHAKKEADYIMGSSFTVWKKVLKKEYSFMWAFASLRIKLEKGSTVGAMAFVPVSETLVDAVTPGDLKYPDELDPDELEKFKSDFKAIREKLGV